MSNTFCPLPWKHLATHPHGSISLCCESDMNDRRSEACNSIDDYQTLQSTSYNFDMITNSDSFNEVRLQFLSGKRPSVCQQCFDAEDLNVISKRQREIERLNFSIDDAREITRDDGSLTEVKYDFVELRLGNHCNLSCRTCNPASSTKWIADYKELYDTEWPYDKEKYEWPIDTKFWKQLSFSISDTVQYIYINGGEPLLVDKHMCFLDLLINMDLAKNINLLYSTNCTAKNDEYVQYWKEFKKVEFMLSIDDIEDRNHYIRYPSEWNQVLDVYKWFMSLRNDYDNILITIMHTISSYNALYIREYVEYMRTIDQYSYFYHNFVYDPNYFNPVHLPRDIKDKILYKVEGLECEDLAKRVLLPDGNNRLLNKFLTITEKLDHIRGNNFSKVFPELYHYFKENGYR